MSTRRQHFSKWFNNHVFINKNKLSKESKDTDSKVILDDNEYSVQEKICILNETTVITSFVPNMDSIDHHGVGVN